MINRSNKKNFITMSRCIKAQMGGKSELAYNNCSIGRS